MTDLLIAFFVGAFVGSCLTAVAIMLIVRYRMNDPVKQYEKAKDEAAEQVIRNIPYGR